MNIIRFNEQFEQMEQEMSRESVPGVILPRGWQDAPLFAYECQYDHEISLLKQATIETRFALPFELMRLSVVERAPERGCYRAEFVIDARDMDSINALVTVKDLFLDWPERSDFMRNVMPLAFDVQNLRWNERDGESAVLYQASFRFGGRWIRTSSLSFELRELVEQMRSVYVNGAVDALAAFALDAMMPSVHIAVVKPDALGRSIEWQRARTHYTLISHGHPANKPSVQHGERVNANGELSRMAHNRRAHYRTLRHERYRFARGKSIFVRATWVGPKEWRDQGGKQIYRILEPVEGL
jgi:hypothetical protein